MTLSKHHLSGEVKKDMLPVCHMTDYESLLDRARERIPKDISEMITKMSPMSVLIILLLDFTVA